MSGMTDGTISKICKAVLDKHMDMEKLEILISKYIDSEITADEQIELEAELKQNGEAQELLGEMLHMHEMTSEAFLIEAGQSKSFEEIYSSAQEQTKPKNIKLSWLKFSSGLAAGLFVGLFLQFGSSIQQQPANSPAAANISGQTTRHLQNAIPVQQLIRQTDPVIRNVDVYHYTDQYGNQYILTGYRDNVSNDSLDARSF